MTTSSLLRPEETVLCLAARSVVGPDARDRLEGRLVAGVDWDRLWQLGHRHEVLPLVTATLTSMAASGGAWSLPADWVAAAQRRRVATLLQNSGMLDELRDALGALGRAHVDVIPIKGLVLSGRLYGDLGLRPAGDIDLLVPAPQLPAAREVLLAQGYRQEARPSYEERHHPFHDAPYYKAGRDGETCLELHWGLAAPGQFDLDTAGLWARSERTEVFGVGVRVLSPEDTLLHLAVHRTRAPLRLRWIADIAESLRVTPSLDVPALLETARASGARTALAVVVDLAARLLDAPVPSGLAAGLTLAPGKRWLLERTCGLPAMFPATDVADDRQQPHLTYRLFEQDGARRIARSLVAAAARKGDKWRDRHLVGYA